MKSLRLAAVLAAAASVSAFAAIDASAQEATTTATYEVTAVDEISVTGAPSLIVNSAVAGSGLTSATASGSYAVTSNGTGRKITASIDTNMPAGLTLSVSLAAPTGGTSAGKKALTSIATDVVTGITQLNESGLAITYTLDAALSAGVVASANKIVKYTITTGV